jgi:3'-phosphoadenosine 5'-phosphosulfate sulfotransferase (PAPS reductase)/FAD synthetase
MGDKKSTSFENKYTVEDLRIMQSWSLQRKIQVTQTRIIEWYQKNNGKVYVSFSGGKDSTVLLDLARRIYPDIPAVFIDTGLEYPELREFVKSISNVVWLKPDMNFRKVIETYGYPIISKNVSRAIHDVKKLGNNCWSARAFDGRETGLYNYTKYKYLLDSPFKISNQCCEVMKKKPLKKYEKQSGNKPIIGTMACESQARKIAWLHNGCNSFSGKNQKSQPMSFWTEQDVLEYISLTGISYTQVYGEIIKDKDGKYHTTKCNRTGCIFCGFGCHLEKEPNRFQRLKETHPKLWEYCMRDWNSGGLGMKSVLEYIGVKIE